MPYADPEKRKQYAKSYYKKAYALNRRELLERNKIWVQQNPDRAREIHENWRKRNRKKINRYYAMKRREDPSYKNHYLRHKEKIANSPVLRIKRAAKARIDSACRRLGIKKLLDYEKLIGCSYDELAWRMERMLPSDIQFNDFGKTWQMDHVEEISAFDLSTLDGQIRAFSINNIQPLRGTENQSKSVRNRISRLGYKKAFNKK